MSQPVPGYNPFESVPETIGAAVRGNTPFEPEPAPTPGYNPFG